MRLLMLRNVVPWLILGVLASAVAASGAEGASEPRAATRYVGLTLTEALLDLETRGLKILFTSHVVRPEMRVAMEPEGGSLEEVLDQLLAPHGLQGEATAGGTLVVVPRPGGPVLAPAAIRGRVVERYSSRPLPGIQILVRGTDISTISGQDGSFSLPEVPPGTRTLEARLPGFVVEELAGVEAVAGQVSEVVFELVPAPLALEEIVVTPSKISLLHSDPISVMALDRDEIVALPHLGDDLFRAMTLLPGISGSELSAEFHIRGGRSDEVMVLLDQQELFEPYHLRDFSNALSIIAPKAIGQVDLILGGFPARFGDRMGGVLDMSTLPPGQKGRTHVGLDILSAQAGHASSFSEDRGDWLAVARYGNLDLVSDYLSDAEKPTYWDAFGKAGYELSPRGRLSLNLLHAEDSLNFNRAEFNPALDAEGAVTSYTSSYLWLSHQALIGSKLFVDSIASGGRLKSDRHANEDDDGEGFTIQDKRLLEFAGLKQDWNFQTGGDRHYLRWGFDVRRLETDYDYFSNNVLDDPIAEIRSQEPEGRTEFLQRFESEQYGVYLSDRLRLGKSLTAELGVRYDEQTLTGDRDLSPRVNLVAAISGKNTLRAAWGHYFQSQRPYELQVEDGETDFFTSELTESSVVGWEHHLESGSHLRVDLYHRDIINPRVRYENVFDPISSFPEIEADRFRFAPDRSTAQGVEFFFRSSEGEKLGWWLNYTYARVEDKIDGRDVRRSIDQPHTLNANVRYELNRHWTLNLAFRYHTGWPTTKVTSRTEIDDEGEEEVVVAFGPINDERLPDYHRLDLRASRQWKLRKGSLTLFLDIQNVYDRENLAGFDFEVDGRLIEEEEVWGGFLPSFGIEWEF